ncbi:MAG: universal stress protein [Desulfobacterales bacterium]|nr:universal stress protein [Desulfobacterales bacterium]
MGKKILLAVDDSVYSERGVRYAARISLAAKNVTYTIFNVRPLVPKIFIEKAETDSEVRAEIDELVRKNTDAARRVVEKFKDLMMREGIVENRIETGTEFIQLGVAKDILNRAEQGFYDVILLARRGLTPRQDFFIGTTAAKVVDHALEIPVWVVAGETISMKIVLAVDGSENSLRAVDHLIHMVGANPDLRLTLFHVLPYLRHYYSVDFEREHPHLQDILEREVRRRVEGFYGKALERLKMAGLKKSQIEIKTNTRSYDVSTAILDEARTGGYGTVVVGRRGESEAFFTGRIAMRLVQKVSDQALWVVP